MNSSSLLQRVQQICQEETTNSENPLQGGNQPRGAKISVENFMMNWENLNRQKPQLTLRPVPIFGPSKVTEPRVQLCVPKEQETSPIPLKYIDVTGSTHTDLDVSQEKRIDDHWNVDSSKHLSDSWRGFTKFTLLKEKPPEGSMWSGRRLPKIPNNYQTRSCMARSLDETR